MALLLVAFLPRALVGFVSPHPLSLTAPLTFGNSISISPNTGIKDLQKALNFPASRDLFSFALAGLTNTGKEASAMCRNSLR